jgi:hypothetical protein
MRRALTAARRLCHWLSPQPFPTISRRLPTATNGGAAKREHAWVQFRYEDGALRNIDLTAKQFYSHLQESYTDNPEGPPFVSVVGRAKDGKDCGARLVPTAQYGRRKKVLKAFASGGKRWDKKMKKVYGALCMTCRLPHRIMTLFRKLL